MQIDGKSFEFRTDNAPVSIVEIGVNHNGDMDLARDLVRATARAGGDIAKFQAFVAREAISVRAEKAAYQKVTTGEGSSQLEMVAALELSQEQMTVLRGFCQQEQVPFLASVFDSPSLEFIVGRMGCAAVKIASSEVTNHPFLAEIAATGAGVILSTGASTLEEVAAARRVIAEAGDPELVLLHCVSEYPAPMAEINLRAMATMARAFGVPVGYSDHTDGIAAPIAAVAMGAVAIEKHFTLDRGLPGPDHRASLEPAELQAMVAGMAAAHVAKGDGIKRPVASEIPQIPIIRKSIVARQDLPVGHVLTRADVTFKRPLNGLPPYDLPKVLGRPLRRPLEADQPLQWDDL